MSNSQSARHPAESKKVPNKSMILMQ